MFSKSLSSLATIFFWVGRGGRGMVNNSNFDLFNVAHFTALYFQEFEKSYHNKV
jgi:hypothetical protein